MAHAFVERARGDHEMVEGQGTGWHERGSGKQKCHGRRATRVAAAGHAGARAAMRAGTREATCGVRVRATLDRHFGQL
jgi:hypothetical protein